MEVGSHKHHAVTFRHVGSSSVLILVFQFLYLTFSSASPRPDIHPYPSNRSTEQTRFTNSDSLYLSPPLLYIRPSISACLTSLHWFSIHVPMVAHPIPVEVPNLQQIHTQALAENCTYPQQPVHTLQLHHSHILNPSHSAIVSCHHLHITSSSPPPFPQAHSVPARQNKFGSSTVSNQCFSGAASFG